MNKFKDTIYSLLDPDYKNSKLARWLDIAILALIFLNVEAVILESIEKYAIEYSTFWKYFEIISVIIFSIEYILRLWSCTTNPNFRQAIKGRLRFALSPLAIVDLFAVLPFFLSLIFALTIDLRILRVVRLFRIIRIFKIGRYSESLKLLSRVLRAKKEELIVCVFISFILLIFLSSILYTVELSSPDTKYKSILDAMWWGLSAMSSIGLVDFGLQGMTPVTYLGKVVGAVVAICGIGLFALPAGVLASGFIGALRRAKRASSVCPHCGKIIIEESRH